MIALTPTLSQREREPIARAVKHVALFNKAQRLKRTPDDPLSLWEKARVRVQELKRALVSSLSLWERARVSIQELKRTPAGSLSLWERVRVRGP
ncbi:hypothetical protein EDC48_116101 [Gibbsiella quercinecans]|uniref:Uncharacterized protein n=1 Tax=Gibbsiella quercinecans TaxID=929813 RepID=A0A250B6Y1_9GAMM|nr:hypothetical protein AWC35_22745 [Gibbsiella quercinecans]RLM04781.1 hypothetical protein BIY31_18600 [Gibbsiella quercinecans]RLM08575.1 hypothetical protein BIY30_12500 [Gibbsiella quercinecans]TCT84844.1 hypothetical protein EDC48_116101 [Gibbsiella quercinecans]